GGGGPEGPLCPGCRIDIFTGELGIDHSLPSVKRLNQDFNLKFSYNSVQARPNFFVGTTLNNNFPDPADSVEASFSLGNKTITTETSRDAILETSVFRLLIEATNAEGKYLPTGSYPYEATFSTFYANSEFATAAFFGAPAGVTMG